MDVRTLREDIPALESCVYLNTGASGPSPRRVLEAANESLVEHQYEAPCGDGMYEYASTALEDARERIARFIGARPAELAFTQSTVDGINRVATAIDWNPGDVVVRTDLEHPAGVLPWERLAREQDVEVRELPTDQGRLDMDDVVEAVSDARLICLSSLSWNYGTRLPVKAVTEVAHDVGALVLVDAVQSVGQTPVDVTEWGADIVVASGHKWLLGLWGSGLMYVSESCRERLTPSHIGYFSTEFEHGELSTFTYREDARRFEHGTMSLSPYVSLAAAIEIVDSIGMETVESRIDHVASRLRDGLGDRLLGPPGANSGLVTFTANEAESTVNRLAEAGISIRALPEPDACRASVHAFNTEADVDRLLAALE